MSGLAMAALTLVPLAATGPAEALDRPQPGERSAPASRSQDGQDRQVRIHNQTGWTMTGLYAQKRGDMARARGAVSRGPDRLAVEALRSGDSLALNIDDGTGACLYDLYAEFANGQGLTRADINVCRIADYYFTR